MLEGQTFIEVFPDYTVPDNLKYVLSNAIVSEGCHETADKTAGCSFEK